MPAITDLLGNVIATPPLPVAGNSPVPESSGRSAKDWAKAAPILAMLPMVLKKGGPQGLAMFLGSLEAAKERKRQQGLVEADRQSVRDRQARLDQRAAQQDAFNQTRQVQQQQLQVEQARRQLTGELREAIGSVTSDTDARALMTLYGPRAEALGIPREQIERFVMETATPSTLQQRAATRKLQEADRALGEFNQDPASFSYQMPGEDAPVTYAELLRRAGYQRDPNAPPPTPRQGALSEFEAFFTNDYLPAVVEQREASGNTLPLTRQEVADLKIQARQRWTGAGRAAPRVSGPTVTERRRAEQLIDERALNLLRAAASGQVPAGVSRQWAAIRREWEALGIDPDARLGSLRVALQREQRQTRGSDVDSFLDDALSDPGQELPGDDMPATVPMPAPPARAGGRGRGAGPAGRGAGAAPAQDAARVASRAQVEAVARRQGVSYAEAKRQLEARGVRVVE